MLGFGRGGKLEVEGGVGGQAGSESGSCAGKGQGSNGNTISLTQSGENVGLISDDVPSAEHPGRNGVVGRVNGASFKSQPHA